MDLIEKLLQVDKKKATEKKKGIYNSKRLENMVGDGTVKITEIDPERISELSSMMIDKKGDMDFSKTYNVALMIAAEGITSPDLRDDRLKEHFGVHTATELAKLLFAGEVTEIADAIQELGECKVKDEEIKN